VGDGGVGTGGELADSLLDERALRVAGAEERQVDDQEHPATLGESDSGQNKAEQQGDLESSDNTHAGIIVLLDESSNGLGEGRLLGGGLGAGGGGRGRGGRSSGLQGRNQVHAAVGCDVEDRVDAERQKSQDELARVQPDESHS
jgi:hypothetical protein